jgi:nucleoside-triphosphatase THEP1
MKITIITGEKGSGKSTYLEQLINPDFGGLITKCINREEKKYYFELINKNRSLLCCKYDDGMKFNKYNFDIINNYLLEINNKNIIIDEIGWMELEEKGFYNTLNFILKKNNIENLYLSVRYDIHKEILKKFNIDDFVLIDLTLIFFCGKSNL